MSEPKPVLSIVIPAKNEAASLAAVLQELKRRHPKAEIVLVDDGSDDGTGEVARVPVDRTYHRQ